jgi:hypothetical protein
MDKVPAICAHARGIQPGSWERSGECPLSGIQFDVANSRFWPIAPCRTATARSSNYADSVQGILAGLAYLHIPA